MARQLLEMAIVYAATGNGPNWYQMGGFWRDDRTLRYMLGFYGNRRYYAAVRRLNPLNYQKISQNKVVEKSLFRTFGIPTPRLLGVICAHAGVCSDGQPLRTAEDFDRFVKLQGDGVIVLKGSEGWGGKAVQVLKLSAGRADPIDLATGQAIDTAAVFATLGIDEGRWVLVEDHIEQHPAMAALNPSSVNTLRLWVIDVEGQPTTTVGFARIGRQGSVVDNRSGGGLTVPLDLATGRLRPAHDGTAAAAQYATHPDHGAQIEGVVVPHFDAAKALAERTLAALPNMRFIGADVAIGPDGPIMVETNSSPDRDGAVVCGVPTAVALRLA